MIGFDIESVSINSSISLNVSAYVSSKIGQLGLNRTETRSYIQLEPCTKQHFSHFPNVQSNLVHLRSHTWQCLPLNQRYFIQGSYEIDGKYQSLNIVFNCSGSCMKIFESTNIWLYTLDSVVNPTNTTNTWQYFLDQVTVPLQPHTNLQYTYDLA